MDTFISLAKILKNMTTEKDKLDKTTYHCMDGEENPKRDCPKREGTPSLDYATFSANTKTGNPSFDAFIDALSREMQLYDSLDPYGKNALNPLTDKADAFLRRHANITYADFLKQAKPDRFTGNDYGKLPDRKNLRERLFAHRAMLYLSSLDDCESNGHDLSAVLREVEQETIPHLKKETDEPTFQEILRILGKKG